MLLNRWRGRSEGDCLGLQRGTPGRLVRRTARSWLAALLALSLTGPATLAAQVVPPADSPAGQAQPGAPTSAQVTTIDRITDNPSAFFGQSVSVVGEVDDVLGERAFTVEDNDLLFDEEVLVVSRSALTGRGGQPLDVDTLDDELLRVRGTVHQFNLAAFEQQLGVDLDDSRFADWGGRPAIIPESIVRWSPATALPYPVVPPGSLNAPSDATIDDILDNPDAYYGEQVMVGGEVDETLGPRSFTLEDSDLLFDEHILVVADRPLVDSQGQPLDLSTLEGRFLWASGTVHEFNQTAFEQQLGVDLDDSRFSDWAGRPAIIANSVLDWADDPTPGTGAAGNGSVPPVAGSAGPSVDAILNNPDTFYGQTTSVTGQIGQMVADRAFVLTDSDTGQEQLLVVSALSLPATLARGDDRTPDRGGAVEVTGEIRQLDLVELEQRIGVNLDDAQLGRWTGEPVIVATSVVPQVR